MDDHRYPEVKTAYSFSGVADHSFANAFLLNLLGDPWQSQDAPIEPFGELSGSIKDVVIPLAINAANSASVQFQKNADLSLNYRVSPASPSNLSVIIPTYNPKIDELEACLESVIQSLLFSRAQNYEVVVINDASPINGGLIEPLIQKLKLRFSLHDQNLRSVVNPKNLGVARTRSRGFIESNQEFIYFIDSDDLVHPWYFPLLHQELLSGYDLTSTSMLLSTGSIFCAANKSVSDILLENSNGAGIALRRNLFDAFKNERQLYNQKNHLHYEDWELNIFVRLMGIKISIVNAPLYYYRISQSGRNMSNTKYHDFSYITTPYNAMKSAHELGIDFPGKEVFPYLQRLVQFILEARYVGVPHRSVSRKALLFSALKLIDEAISKKMILTRTYKFLKHVVRRSPA